MTNVKVIHQKYMQRALELAALGRFSSMPNPMVGCVIVADGTIVGEGWHAKAGEPHAEVHALRAAGAAARGATAYVTLEPCSHHGRTPPCVDALLAAGIGHVVIAMEDPNPLVSGQGIARLRDQGVAVTVGILADAARRLNQGFVARMERQRPWLQVKMAASIDGKTALVNGESQWITSPQARQDVHRWRAQSSAILSSAATVLADGARLTARHPHAQQQPLRVIIDSKGLLTADLPLFKETSPILLVQAEETPVVAFPEHVERLILPLTESGNIDLPALFQALAEKQVNRVWTECGAQLAGALLQANLVDELVIYLAPKLIGAAGLSLVALPEYTAMAQIPELTFTDVRQVGDDLRIIAEPRMTLGDQLL